MFFSCPALRLFPFVPLHASLTPAVTGRRPTVSLRFMQIRKRAAVTCTGWLDGWPVELFGANVYFRNEVAHSVTQK